MKKRTADLILKDPEKFAHHDRVFLNNPVVMQGMGLAPLVVLATSGAYANPRDGSGRGFPEVLVRVY